MKEIDDLENALCIAVLSAILQIPKNFGYTKTIGFLQWAQSRYILSNKLQDNKFFGCFSLFNKDSLEKIIEYLHKNSFIEIKEVWIFNREILIVSKYWSSVLAWEEDTKLNGHLFLKKDIDIQNEGLYDRLSELRYELAKHNKISSFCIFSNETLILLTNKRPTTEEEMIKIKWIGPEKINKYGKQFIEKIKEYICGSTWWEKEKSINTNNEQNGISVYRTNEDDQRLESLFKKGVSEYELSKIFEKPLWEIDDRLKKLWLKK